MKRSGFTKPRKPMKRGKLPAQLGADLDAVKAFVETGKKLPKGFKRRTKRMGPGKKKLAQVAATTAAILSYFDRFGWLNEEGQRMAPCQMSGDPMHLEHANAHHKTPRSELRKAKVPDLDAPHRLLICHYRRHLAFLHGGKMGRHGDTDANRRLRLAELDEANAENGLVIGWGAQDALDLGRLR